MGLADGIRLALAPVMAGRNPTDATLCIPFAMFHYLTVLLAGVLCHALPVRAQEKSAPFPPPPPPSTKLIAEYSPSDVLGCFPISVLPEDHPLNQSNHSPELIMKSSWPGASDPRSIDAFMALVLNSPSVSNAASPDKNTQSGRKAKWRNLHTFIDTVMDVSDHAKVEALLRVANAQTDPLKKRQALEFASDFFPDTLDLRLLAIRRDQLDDATALPTLDYEDGPAVKRSVRSEARRSLLWSLNYVLGTGADTSSFEAGDEAKDCPEMKKWLVSHWPAIEARAKWLLAIRTLDELLLGLDDRETMIDPGG